ncbi:MAG: cob(I)yrinic acid a,c-diamide adenosyltransferase [Pseudobdellovibrio sp.]
MKIYTKTGDKGTTKLVDGSCVEKFNPRVEAYGCVDELNSQIGVIRSLLGAQVLFRELDQHFEIIQNQLFSVGSLLATAEKEVFLKLPQIKPEHVTQLERWIDRYTEELPALKNFILPGGDLAASHIHVARTSCRRAERRSTEIAMSEAHYDQVLIYLNRLSDLLFTWARWVNVKTGNTEVIWKKEHV